MKRFAITIWLFTLAPALAVAQGHGYLGGTLGGTRLDDGDQLEAISLDDSGVAVGVYGGYQFNRYFAVEGALKWLGRYTTEFSTQRYLTVTGAAVGILPVGESGFDCYGQVGVGGMSLYGLDYDDELETTGGDDRDINTTTASYGPTIHLGLGLRYTPPSVPRMTLRAGYEHFFFRLRSTAVFIQEGDDLVVEFEDETRNQTIGSFFIGGQYNF